MQAANKVLRGRYRIIRHLGQSETSAVYKAFDSVRETNIALKEIFIDLDKVPGITEREILKRDFANQAKNLAKVKHESLPQLRGYFSEIDRHYLVMELVEGEDAGELLTKNKSFVALSEINNWADQLLDTLDYLHTLTPPIVHGDIKPQNVMLTSRGKTKLLGFDITPENMDSNALPDKQNSSSAALRYSSLEQVLRTADLTAQKAFTEKYGDKIEKILSVPIDGRSDIYALGATLYHLATARPPLNSMERIVDVWTGKSDPLASPNQINSEVPTEISDVLMKALEIERENRFNSAMEMRQALQTAIGRAKERAAEDAKKKEADAALEIRQAEEKRLEEERQRIERERLRIEEEQKRQNELIARQLKIAETERSKAEQRAAEAEKLLLEKESKKSADAVKNSKVSAATNFSPKVGKQTSAPAASTELFTEQKANSKSSWMMPAIVVTVLVLGGIIGLVFLRSSNTVESKQTNPVQTNSLSEKALTEPKVENTTQPIAEKIVETTETPMNSAPTISDKTQSSFRNKPIITPPAPRVVKSNAPPTKASANQKKAVTVDDLIGGN